MKKRGGHKISIGKVNIMFSNRIFYSLIAILVLAVVGVGVYAGTPITPIPNPGHLITELQKCPNGETLEMISGSWTCVAFPTGGGGGSSQWTTLGSDIYYNNGKIGIGTGTTAPTEKLQVAGGNALISGSVTAAQFYYSSDANLKENIKPLSNSLEKIQQLQGVSFNWKNNGNPSVGLIAQDVEKVYPELVSTGIDGNKAVQYGNLVAPLIESVKEQQKQINELKSEIEALKLMCGK